jgi:conjugative relaxase-like TrwC/TraI family protein
MVSISKAQSIAHAGQYYREHYSGIEYYAPKNAPTIGQALGHGAIALGLNGGVTAAQFDALLHGKDPQSGAILRSAASHGTVNRAGWDVTLSPPKSISIQALVAGDERIIEAHRESVRRAIEEAEKCALSRQHGGSEWVQSGNICAVVFEHYDARESVNSQHGPMPQLHHHVFITNLTQRPDGEWRSLDPEQIFKARGYLDAVYMTELSKRVQQLGYAIEQGPDGIFELAGFTRNQILAFSERYTDIELEKAKRGITDPVAAREVVIDTRKAKRNHDPQVLKAEREALAAWHGIDLTNRPTLVVTPAISPISQARQSLDWAVEHATNREAVADYRTIAEAALRHGIGLTDVDSVKARIDAEQHRGHLIAAGATPHHPLDSYTTEEMVRLERENLAIVRQGIGQPAAVAGITLRSAVDGSLSSTGEDEVREWAATKKLLPDQADAAVLTLNTPAWATAIEGLAGSTKTTTVGAVREFAEEKGWTVRGFGTTSGSVKALMDARINAQTIAKTLANALPAKHSRELWIVDESSLLATRPVNELLKLARDRGVERIVFVGDQKQHLAIEAGSPVRQFLANNLAVAQLTTIRRQKDPDLRHAVELAAGGRPGEAIERLIEQRRIVEVPKAEERYQLIATEYLHGHEAGENVLVVSPGNDERRALNQAIRSKLVAHGYIATLNQEHRILIRRDMTPAQIQHAGSYHEGDVICFSRGSKAQHIPKRAYLTVTAVNENGFHGSLTLELENSRRLDFDPSRWKGLSVYSQESRTIAVGDRLQWREPDNKRRIANGEMATIRAISGNNIAVEFDKGRKVEMPLSDARKVDLGYASTSHASQGATVDRVIVNIDSQRSPELVNDRQFYVSLSRSRTEARIYTDSVEGMRRAVSRKQEKELALDIAQKQRPTMSMRI